MRFASYKKYAVLALLVALVGGILHALPYFGAPATPTAIVSAARGVAALKKLPGYGDASLLDGVAARLWRSGGGPALAWGESVGVLLGWTLAGFAVLAVVWLASRWVAKPRTRAGIFAIASVIVLATAVSPVWRWFSHRGQVVHATPLLLPMELAEAVKDIPANATFANAATLSQFMLLAPDSVGRLTPQQAAGLAVNPTAWRKAARLAQWNAVVLSGSATEYRPLLEHLITSSDWRLALVTNQGYLFLRNTGTPVKTIDVENFKQGSDRDTAIYLAQLAERYDAIRRPADASASIDRALELAPNDVTVLSHAASFAAGRKHWQDAITYTGRALAQDPSSTHAKLVRSLALLETGEAAQAQNICDEILHEAPNDLYTLFLYARICREIHDYAQEAYTLERLIKLSEKMGLSTVNYRIYLGQAYARQGQPEPALKSYRAVLDSGLLGPEQAQEIQSAISEIEENAPKN
jgi:tetratricopeptide (TPR) repeat protein